VTLSLVIGGTRSGKSARAERVAAATGLPVRYVATADGTDPAYAQRIAAHRARRPPEWTTVQALDELAAAFAGAGRECVLLDGLGVWLAGVLHRAGALRNGGGLELDRYASQLRITLQRAVRAAADAGAAVVVAEQAGEGLLPSDPGSRLWLDLLGEATQVFADVADRVELVVAGRAVPLDPLPAETVSLADLRRHGDRDVRPGDADHAVSVVQGGPPPWLRRALVTALDSGADRYPDEAAATRALAARHGRMSTEIVPTNGAAEALWLLPAALRPRLAAVIHPAFTEAEAALHAHGVAVTRVLRSPDADFAINPDAVQPQADLVIVGNPASASATLAPAASLLALRRPGRTIVVDEAFMDLVPGEPGSLASEALEDVIVIRSITKSFGIPGIRAGYALAAPRLADRLRAARPPWSANVLALAALVASAEHPNEAVEIARQAAAQRDDLRGRLGQLNAIRTWPGVANFCLIEVPDGPATLRRLRDHGVAVRPAASFPGLGPNHIRLTARDPDQNARLIEVLERCL
jgi:histidinol-phosphate/aromatic aminotransferase/cobyric acid decarboxylase-like protein/adenosyl cobinamide kinase/adenosyl cobinamide phosphate guanylyltransferase